RRRRGGRDLERGRRGYRAAALHLCRPGRSDRRRERIVGQALPRAACKTLIQCPEGQRFLSGSKAMVLGRRLSSLTFLSQQSFGYCPRAKCSRSNTRAGLVGYLFEMAHNALALMWQPGAYIRSCELSSVVERAHSNVARNTTRWGRTAGPLT